MWIRCMNWSMDMPGKGLCFLDRVASYMTESGILQSVQAKISCSGAARSTSAGITLQRSYPLQCGRMRTIRALVRCFYMHP